MLDSISGELILQTQTTGEKKKKRKQQKNVKPPKCDFPSETITQQELGCCWTKSFKIKFFVIKKISVLFNG